MTDDTPISDPEIPLSGTGSSQPRTAELLTASALLATTTGLAAVDPKLPPSEVTDTMTSHHDQTGPGRPRGRRGRCSRQ